MKQIPTTKRNRLFGAAYNFVPDISRFVVRSIVFSAIIGTVAFTASSLRSFHLTLTLDGIIPTLAYWVLDPVLIHAYGGLLLVGVLFARRGSSDSNPTKNKRARRIAIALVLGIVLVSCLFVVEIVLENYLFKPIFHEIRPAQQYTIAEPPVTAFFERLLNMESEPGAPTSAPSGFVLRQMILFCTILVLAQKLVPRKGLFAFILCVNAGLLILMAVSRVLVGAHTFYDAGIAFGVGNIVFWPSFFLVYSFLGKKQSETHITDVAALCLLLIPICFLLSEESSPWVIISVVVFGVLTGGYTFTSDKWIKIAQKLKGESQRT